MATTDTQTAELAIELRNLRTPDILLIDLGLRVTWLPSEAGRDSYQDFAVPFNGQ